MGGDGGVGLGGDGGNGGLGLGGNGGVRRGRDWRGTIPVEERGYLIIDFVIFEHANLVDHFPIYTYLSGLLGGS